MDVEVNYTNPQVFDTEVWMEGDMDRETSYNPIFLSYCFFSFHLFFCFFFFLVSLLFSSMKCLWLLVLVSRYGISVGVNQKFNFVKTHINPSFFFIHNQSLPYLDVLALLFTTVWPTDFS